MNMRAAILREMGLAAPYSQSKPIKIESCRLDPPGKDEVLIRIRRASLCHSDLSVVNGSRPRVMPIVLGHEVSGEVVEVGEGVAEFAAGDHVICFFVPGCGRCLPCKEGRPALCEPGADANLRGVLLSGERRLHLAEESCNHHLGISGFAEYAVVSRASIVKIEKAVTFEIAALFGCAVITGVGAVVNTARVQAGSSVAIVGAGGVGLSCILGSVLAGARQIIAIDVSGSKLAFAKELGATDCVNGRDADAVEQVKSLSGGGVDYGFETAGVPETLKLAYLITRRGGTTVAVSLPDPKQEFSIPQIGLTLEERTVKGSFMGSCVPLRDIPRYIDLYQRGRLPVDRLITHRIGLDEINAGFDTLAGGEAGRVVMTV